MGCTSLMAARRGEHHRVRPHGGKSLDRWLPPSSSHRCSEIRGGSKFSCFFKLIFIVAVYLTVQVHLQARRNQFTIQSMASVKSQVRHIVQPDTIIRDGVPDKLSFQSIRNYCKSVRVVEPFNQLGEPLPAPGSPPRKMYYLLADAGQWVTRDMLMIEKDLFDHNLCLTQVRSDTFVVETSSKTIYLSTRAFREDIVPINHNQRKKQVDDNMYWLSDLIVTDVIGSNPTPIEVEHGLIPLMKRHGFDMLHVIINHPCLVPIANRLDLNLRMHDQVRDVIANQGRTAYNQVLSGLIFPSNWHALVKSNCYLLHYYGKSNYSLKPKKNLSQQINVLRFHRNVPEHGMETSVNTRTKKLLFTRPDLGRLLYTVFPLFLHSIMVGLHKIGRLKELDINSLFMYKRGK